jgi:autotransporter-associated beta strand protein
MNRLAFPLAAAIAALFASQTASAVGPYYWDNLAGAGFGTAGGTWSATTAGPIPGWNTDPTGTTAPASVLTGIADALNFGNGAAGLAGGTITVSGTVNAGDITFASGSGAIVLSGGTINLAAAETITVHNATTTVSSILSGASTSLTKSGSGALILSGSLTYTGNTVVSEGILDFAPASGSSTLTGNITGSGAITKSGNGTTILATATANGNTFSGTLAVNGGTLEIGNTATSNSSTQRLAAVSSVSVASGATLVLRCSSALADGTAPLTLAGTLAGDTTATGSGGFHNRLGALTLNGGTLTTYKGGNSTSFQAYTFRENVTVVGTSPSFISSGGTSGNGIHLNNNGTTTARIFDVADVTSSAAADLTVSARLLNTSSTLAATGLIKTGAGTMVLSGANTYSGNTTVNAGRLVLGTINTSNELSTITIAASGASLQLNFTGTDTVSRLFIGTSLMAAGIYGHSSTGAANGGLGVGALDAYFAAGTGTLTVTLINNVPVATAQSVSTPEDTTKAITLTGTDAEGSALTYTIVTAPTSGTLSGTVPNLTYIPAPNFSGAASFTFKVNDGRDDSAIATVSITVTAVNDAPVAIGDSVSTPVNTARAITLVGTDVDGNSLTYTIVTPPVSGTLSGTAPNVIYTPSTNFTGAVSFTFNVNDGTADSPAAMVSITVNDLATTHFAERNLSTSVVKENSNTDTILFKNSVPGHLYQLQQSDDLTSGSWTNVGRAIIGSGQHFAVQVPHDPALTRQFYRFQLGSAGLPVGTPGLPEGAPKLPGVVLASDTNGARLVRYDASGALVPLRAFGVNHYDAFLRYLKNVNNRSFTVGFDYLAAHDIPVARVMASAFYPSEWNLYFTNKTEYYRRLDDFILQAETRGIGLILTVFFTVGRVGEIVDDAVAAGFLTPGVDFVPPSPLNLTVSDNPTYAEYRNEIGRSDSGSNAFISYYTRELVARYKNSPAVWGWEFSNEVNLSTDLPNANQARPTPTASLGMFLKRDDSTVPTGQSKDDLTRAHMTVAKNNFASCVREVDPWRFITTGDAVPRPSAYHNWTALSWTLDTRSQLAQVVPVDNPPSYSSICIHVYPGDTTYFTDAPSVNLAEVTGDYSALLAYFQTQANTLGQPLFLGEYGAKGDGTTTEERATFHRLVQAIIDQNLQLSLLWDFDNQNSGQATEWWVNPGTAKEYQLTNPDPNLWDLEQANGAYGVW